MANDDTPEFPEHEKLKQIQFDRNQPATQIIGEFLEWFREDDQSELLNHWTEGYIDEEDILYAYYKIDKDKIEVEKQEMLNRYVENRAKGAPGSLY